MSRPNVLYHGSSNPNIQLIEPREEDLAYGKVISASQYKTIAAMYLAPKGFPTFISRFDDAFVIVVQATPDAFIAADHGGAIYVLPVDGFKSDPAVGMQESEWRSMTPVKPLTSEVYETARAAISQAGAKLYLVDKQTFTHIKNADDHGWGIIQSLRPFNG